jgi:chromate transporter
LNQNLISTPQTKPGLYTLFISFMKLGLTSFGGPAMVVFIRKMAVEQKKWLDEETFRYGAAICQSIPGAISMQAAAYVGLRVRNITGAAVSFIGFGLPAFIFLMILSAIYAGLHTLPAMLSLFSGLGTIVIAITANATLSFGKTTLLNWRDIIITCFAAIMFIAGIHPILTIISAAILGLILYFNKRTQSRPKLGSAHHYSLKPVFILIAITILLLTILFFWERKLFDLSILMLRIDLFAFGGGYAAVPLMYHEVVEVNSWLSPQTFLDGIVLGQVTPGPIVMTATFVGYLLYGFIGGIVATISVFLPSFILILVTVPYFDKMQSLPYFTKAIRGILCSFVGLLLAVTLQFAGNINWDIAHVIISIAAFTALLWRVDILWIVLAGAVISMIVIR